MISTGCQWLQRSLMALVSSPSDTYLQHLKGWSRVPSLPAVCCYTRRGDQCLAWFSGADIMGSFCISYGRRLTLGRRVTYLIAGPCMLSLHYRRVKKMTVSSHVDPVQRAAQCALIRNLRQFDRFEQFILGANSKPASRKEIKMDQRGCGRERHQQNHTKVIRII